jgi:hypothetical protein
MSDTSTFDRLEHSLARLELARVALEDIDGLVP